MSKNIVRALRLEILKHPKPIHDSARVHCQWIDGEGIPQRISFKMDDIFDDASKDSSLPVELSDEEIAIRRENLKRGHEAARIEGLKADFRPKVRRIQRKRDKGWRMPAGAIYVGRPTKWANPYRADEWMDGAKAVNRHDLVFDGPGMMRRWASEQAAESFADDIQSGAISMPLDELRGKDLVCWCPVGQYCHADVLLELANKPLNVGPLGSTIGLADTGSEQKGS